MITLFVNRFWACVSVCLAMNSLNMSAFITNMFVVICLFELLFGYML
jgi:hypothetical protein